MHQCVIYYVKSLGQNGNSLINSCIYCVFTGIVVMLVIYGAYKLGCFFYKKSLTLPMVFHEIRVLHKYVVC